MKNKFWQIIITRVTSNDVEGERRESYPKLYRHGVSERQVEARLRHTEGMYDYDNYDSSVSVRYEFNITEVVPEHGYEQLSLF